MRSWTHIGSPRQNAVLRQDIDNKDSHHYMGHDNGDLHDPHHFALRLMASIDGRLGEAAVNLGAGRLASFFRVTLPLCMPSILSGFLIILFHQHIVDYSAQQ